MTQPYGCNSYPGPTFSDCEYEGDSHPATPAIFCIILAVVVVGEDARVKKRKGAGGKACGEETNIFKGNSVKYKHRGETEHKTGYSLYRVCSMCSRRGQSAEIYAKVVTLQ